jgi:hypothetical protein
VPDHFGRFTFIRAFPNSRQGSAPEYHMGGTDFYAARSACSKKRYSVGSTTSVRSVLEDKAPDDHCGRRLLHFCTGSRRARHRNKPQRSYKGRHEYWPKPSK